MYYDRPGAWSIGLTCCYCLDVIVVESGLLDNGSVGFQMPICECGGQRWMAGRLIPNVRLG